MIRTLLGSAVLCFSVLLCSACSSEDPDSPGEASVIEVKTVGERFEPSHVTIKAGQTVRWTWSGGPHNVVSGTNCSEEGDGNFHSGQPSSAGTFDKRFETPGTFDYYCAPHCVMGMKGQIVVEP